MKGLKKICAVITAAALLMLSMSSCSEKGSGGQDNGGQVTLKVWHLWASDTNQLGSRYRQAVKDYMDENPNVKIVTESLDTDAYKTKISTEFSSDASGIDVFYWWGSGTVENMVNSGKILPLDEYITDEVKGRMAENSTSAFTFNGKTYSVPMFAWYEALFCNKEIFDRAGAKIPETYDELVDAVKKIQTLEGITPIASGAKDGWNAAQIYQGLAVRDVGANNVNKMLKGEIGIDKDNGYRTAAEKIVELNNMGAFGKNPLEQNNDDANSAFISGKAAMRVMGSWFANQVYTDESATIDPKNVVAVEIPTTGGKSDATEYNGGFVESFWVNANTKYKDEAAKFCLYINERMGDASYETGTGFSGWKNNVDESNVNDLFKQIKQLLDKGKQGVLAWDTSLNSNAATTHNEMVQTLFGKNPDLDEFIEAQKDAME